MLILSIITISTRIIVFFESKNFIYNKKEINLQIIKLDLFKIKIALKRNLISK